MPLYEFECVACGHVFEELAPLDRQDGPPCPRCGAATGKLLSAPRIVTSGGGAQVPSPGAGGCNPGSGFS